MPVVDRKYESMSRIRVLIFAVAALTLAIAIPVVLRSVDQSSPRTHQDAQSHSEHHVLNSPQRDSTAVAGEVCDATAKAQEGSREIRVLVGVVDCHVASRVSARYTEDTTVAHTGHGRLATIGQWDCSSLYVDSRGRDPYLQCTDPTQNSFTIELPAAH